MHTLKKFSRLQKLYLFTFIFEPLLFFLIADRNLFGISINISRLLQLYVLIEIFLRFLILQPRIQISHTDILISKGYFIYVMYGILVTLIGIIGYQYGFDKLILPPGRTNLEIIISIYYFIYFVLLPIYLFPSKTDLLRVIRVLLFTFKIVLLIGFLDLILLTLGLPSIPRHLGDVEVGFRFHSILGEPRDAAVYLIFMTLVVFTIKRYFESEIRISKYFYLITSTAFLLTFSLSGLIAISIICGFLFLRFLVKDLFFMPIKKLFVIFFVFLLSLPVFFFILSSERFQLYIDAFSILIELLKTNIAPATLSGQMVNIFPLWHRFTEFTQGHIFWTIFGSGIGTASIINNYYYDLANLPGNELLNPHSNLIRIFFETGLIGFLLFMRALSQPINLFLVHSADRKFFYIFYLIMFSCFLAHRTILFFISLGIMLLFIKFLKSETG